MVSDNSCAVLLGRSNLALVLHIGAGRAWGCGESSTIQGTLNNCLVDPCWSLWDDVTGCNLYAENPLQWIHFKRLTRNIVTLGIELATTRTRRQLEESTKPNSELKQPSQLSTRLVFYTLFNETTSTYMISHVLFIYTSFFYNRRIQADLVWLKPCWMLTTILSIADCWFQIRYHFFQILTSSLENHRIHTWWPSWALRLEFGAELEEGSRCS